MTAGDRYLRLPDVLDRTGLSRRTIYRRISSGTFPRQRPISDGAVAWLESEITAWQQAPMEWSEAA